MFNICSALFLLCLLICPGNVSASDNGGLPRDMTRQWQTQSPADRDELVSDIIANRGIRDFALNRELFIAHNTNISNKIDTGSITNQKGSGRCWIFAGFNTLRPHLIKKLDLKDFEFSESYLQFWDKIEKSNKYLQLMIDFADHPLDDRKLADVMDSPIGDGGWWSYFVDLTMKYGVVPKKIMPETNSSSSTSMMNFIIQRKLIEMGLDLRQQKRSGSSDRNLCETKEEMMAEIYRMLTLNLGEPPLEFTWQYAVNDTSLIQTYPETLTPQKFFTDVIDLDLTAYVALFNYPGKEYERAYAFEFSRNIYDQPDFTILNMPMDSLKAAAARSILDSTAVWFACDVGEEHYTSDGIMVPGIYNYEEIYGINFNSSRTDLIRTGQIDPNHAMTFTGIDIKDDEVIKWYVENSWGDDGGDGGMYYMYDDWFDRYLFGVIIHKRYLSEDVVRLSEQPPLLLEPWDPMAGLDSLD